MGNLAQLKGTMFFTILITLVIFIGFIIVVSFFFSYATDLQLDPVSILIGAFILAIFFMLIQFAISPSIVKWSTRLRYLQPGENAWLEGMVAKLAQQAGVKAPRLAIVPDRTPNAFVFGNSSNNMTLAVNQGLLDQLKEDEIQGVLGHEIGHIRHKDSIIMTFMSAVPLIAFVIVRMAFGFGYVGGMGGGRRGSRDNGAIYIILAGVIALTVYFVAQLLVLRLSRLRETYADAVLSLSYSGSERTRKRIGANNIWALAQPRRTTWSPRTLHLRPSPRETRDESGHGARQPVRPKQGRGFG